MFGDKIQPPGGATINRLTICIDMYHITGKISADERVVEEITPDQPSADDLIKHYDNCKIMRNADTALKHAKKKHNHFLNNFELVVERHASLTAPTGEGLIIKVSVQCGRCQLILSPVKSLVRWRRMPRT